MCPDPQTAITIAQEPGELLAYAREADTARCWPFTSFLIPPVCRDQEFAVIPFRNAPTTRPGVGKNVSADLASIARPR